MSQDPYRYFRVEAREILEQLGRGVLEIEKGSPAPDVAPLLLRLAHTLKGAARVVRQARIAELAHAVEEVLAPLRETGATIGRDRVDEVLKLLDAIAALVAALDQPQDRGAEAPAQAAGEEPPRTVRTEIAEMDALLEGLAEAGIHMKSVRQSISIAGSTRRLCEQLGERIGPKRLAVPAHPDDEAVPAGERWPAEEISTHLSKLERTLTSGADQLEREMRQVRDAAERLRLIPAGAVFTSLERAVRDAARALGKRAVFESKGGDVRLDAHVLEVLQGALVQIVRNAIAHGIETDLERVSAGKPPAGRVELSVSRRGNRVAFECRDDGRGVDLEAVRRIAREKGLLSPEGHELGVEDLLRLLLGGGFTTSGTVSQMSGRGIGLDIAREAAAGLGGEIVVHTEAGIGTSFELIVPVSLSSLEALLVEAGGVVTVLPLGAVRRTLRVSEDELARTADGDSIAHEGEVIAFVPLARLLHGRPSLVRRTRAWPAVVVAGSSTKAAVGVDRILGTANVVVRPIPPLTPADPVVAGASLDADGVPRLVLDPDRLVAAAACVERPAQVVEAGPPAPVLVIDDSLTTRMLEQSILESAGYEVDLATSAEEALTMARRRRYGLFLVDVEMSGMGGFAFVERARADQTLREIPSILVTSRNSPEDRRRGEEAGAREYIVKSEFDQGRLLETIRGLVG